MPHGSTQLGSTPSATYLHEFTPLLPPAACFKVRMRTMWRAIAAASALGYTVQALVLSDFSGRGVDADDLQDAFEVLPESNRRGVVFRLFVRPSSVFGRSFAELAA